MATPAQVTANRANAQLSTGPRSVEGKAAASRNSLKLGITAQSLIIPGEDPAELYRLAAAYELELPPVGPVEIELLAAVVRSAWMQRRYARIEAAYLTSRLAALPEDTPHSLGAVMAEDGVHGNTLQKIFRRQQAAQRDWNKALDTLCSIQANRHRLETEAAAAAAAALNPSPLTPFPPNRVRFATPPQAAARVTPQPPENLALRL